MSKIQSFKDLIVWQEAINLAEMVYLQTGNYPKEELYGLTSQTRRAAVSVPANIAEGYGRNNRKKYIQFIGIANASLAELETHLLLAQRLNYLDDQIMEYHGTTVRSCR